MSNMLSMLFGKRKGISLNNKLNDKSKKSRDESYKNLTHQKEMFHQHSGAYFYNVGKPAWSERNYESFSQEAYINNVMVHRAISMIARAAASIPLALYRKRKCGREERVQQHPILDLLQTPNQMQSRKEFMESVYMYRQISGNAYIFGVIDDGCDCSGYNDDITDCYVCVDGKNGRTKNYVRELYTLRPDRVQVITGHNFIPSGYRYTIDNRHKDYMVNLSHGQSQILHIKNFHPLSDWYGLSSIEAAAFSIDQHNQASSWNQALLQHGARPCGAIVVKGVNGEGGHLTDEQFTRLKQNIEETICGAQNAGRPLILEGGLEWKTMSMSPQDMDYVNIKNCTAREIALALGVPPQLLGIPGDNTYSNLAEARVALWEQTIVPLVDNTVGCIGRWLLAINESPVGRAEKCKFDEINELDERKDDSVDGSYRRDECELELRYDASAISALAEKTEQVWTRVEKSSFMTRDEKRRAVGLGDEEGQIDG